MALGVQPPRRLPKREGTPIHILFPLLLPSEQGPTVTPSPYGREGQRGSWGKGQPWWEGAQPAPAATERLRWGERWLISSCPHSVPALRFLRKNSLFSFSIQGPERGTCVGGEGGVRGAGGGGVLASSLSFLPGQPAGPKSLQAPGRRAQHPCQDGGGGGGARGSVPAALCLPAGEWGGSLGKGGAAPSVFAQPPSLYARHRSVDQHRFKTIPLILIFMNLISCLNVQKFSGLCSLAPSCSPLLCACSGPDPAPGELRTVIPRLAKLISCLLPLRCFSSLSQPCPTKDRIQSIRFVNPKCFNPFN